MLSIPVFVQSDPLQGGGAIDLDRSYGGADLRWRWSADAWGRPFSLTTGIEYAVSDERRRGYENFVGDQLGVFGALRRDEGNRVTGRDAYVQADWQLADRWRINVGARYSQVRFVSDDHYITATIPTTADGCGIRARRRWPACCSAPPRTSACMPMPAAVSRRRRSPNWHIAATAERTQRRLRAAHSRNIEAGLRARHGGHASTRRRVFDSRTEGELVVVANEGGRSVYGNAGITPAPRRRTCAVRRCFRRAGTTRRPTPSSMRAMPAISPPAARRPCASDDVLIESGHPIPGISRHSAWAELRWSPRGRAPTSCSTGVSPTASTSTMATTTTAPAYASFDLAAEHRFEFGGLQWRGYARIDNLFDRRFVGSVSVNDSNGRYYEPAPGRNWVDRPEARPGRSGPQRGPAHRPRISHSLQSLSL